jgi:phage terminase small subunit
MRSLALLLLLANISFLSWQLNQFPWLPWQPEHVTQSHSSEGKPSISNSNLPQLVLLREPHESNLNSQLSPQQPDVNTSVNLATAKSSADNPQKNSPLTPVVTNLAENQTQEIGKITHTQDGISKEQPTMAKPLTQLMTSKAVNDHSTVAKANAEKKPAENAEEKLAKPLAATSATTLASASQLQQAVKLSADQKQPKIESSSANPVQSVNKVTSTANLVKPLTSSANQQVICFESGPYTQALIAQPVYNWLKNNSSSKNKSKIKGDIQVEIQPRQTQVLESTWVYLPPFKSRQAADMAQQRLNQLGIADYMVVTQGQFDNAISLGRYRNPANVQQRLKELSTKGYQNIKTQERYKSDTRYWLNVKISPKESQALLSAFNKHFKNLTLKQVGCESLAKAG